MGNVICNPCRLVLPPRSRGVAFVTGPCVRLPDGTDPQGLWDGFSMCPAELCGTYVQLCSPGRGFGVTAPPRSSGGTFVFFEEVLSGSSDPASAARAAALWELHICILEQFTPACV